MKKSVRRLAFGALAAAAAVQFAACRNRPETVYGPPEYFTKTDPANNVPEDVYGPPEMLETLKQDVGYEPSEDTPEAVYGPPEMFGIEETEESVTPEAPEEETAPETAYDPAADEPEDVYGPPSMFEPSAPAEETEKAEADEAEAKAEAETEATTEETEKAETDPGVLVPETFYEPAKNEMICMYGPPEMFERMEKIEPESGAAAETSAETEAQK